MSELNEIRFFMDELAEDVEILWGVYRDNDLGDKVKVALVATDFAPSDKKDKAVDVDNEKQKRWLDTYYGKTEQKRQTKVVEPVSEQVKEPETKAESDIDNDTGTAETNTDGSTGETKKCTFLDKFLTKLNKVVDIID